MSNWLVKKAEMEDVSNTLYKEVKREHIGYTDGTADDVVIVQDKSNDEYLVGVNLSEDMSGHTAAERGDVERFNNIEQALSSFDAYVYALTGIHRIYKERTL